MNAPVSVLVEPPMMVSWGPTWSALAGLNLVALLLLIVCLAAWARHPGRGRLVRGGGLTMLAIAVVYLLAVQPSDIPIDWVTLVHEGLGYKNIRHLYGLAVHAGANFAVLTNAIAAGAHPTLFEVVWLNLLLAMLNAVFFFCVARAATGTLWAVVWTAAYALNPATFTAAFSELPTNLLAFYFLAGVVGWAVLVDPQAQPRAARAAGFVLCALLTLFSALTREEVGFVGIVALGAYALHAMIGAARWQAALGRLATAGEQAIAYLAARPGLVVAACAVGLVISQTGLPWFGRALAAGLYPFNPSFLNFFIFLTLLLLPAGIAIGIAAGFVVATRDFRLFGGLALSLFLLIRAYLAAQDQYYETGRYLSYIFPALFLLGAIGSQRLVAWLRPNPALWARALLVLFLMSWFTRALPGTPDLWLQPEYHWNRGFSEVLLDLNTQKEIRHLLRVTEENPECVFVARVVETFVDPKVNPVYDYAVFGKPMAQPIFVPVKDATLEQVIERYAGDAACVQLYFGGDCNLNFADDCAEFIAGRRLLTEERYWSRVYNNPHDYGYPQPVMRLATYAWP